MNEEQGWSAPSEPAQQKTTAADGAVPAPGTAPAVQRGFSPAVQVVLALARVLAVGLAASALFCWRSRSVSSRKFDPAQVEANPALLWDSGWANEVAAGFYLGFFLVWLVAMILLIVWRSGLIGVSRAMRGRLRQCSRGEAVGEPFVPAPPPRVSS